MTFTEEPLIIHWHDGLQMLRDANIQVRIVYHIVALYCAVLYCAALCCVVLLCCVMHQARYEHSGWLCYFAVFVAVAVAVAVAVFEAVTVC